MIHFKSFLIERLSMADLVMLSVENNPAPHHFEGRIEVVYKCSRGIESSLKDKIVHYICGPASWGNKSSVVGTRTLMFIDKKKDKFYEYPWKGHIDLEEIEGELHGVIRVPNKWDMQGIPFEIAEGVRTDPRCENHSIIPFRLLEPLLIQLITEIETLVTLRYHQYWLKCGDCDVESRFPVYEHSGYVLMRNPKNGADCRLVSYTLNSAHEVARLARKSISVIAEKLVRSEEHKKIILEKFSFEQKCFAHICDPINDVKYQFDLGTVCPHCHSHNIKGWWPTETPYETIDLEIPYITHHHWDSLNQDEKEKIIHDEVFRLVTEKLKELEEQDKI